MLTEYINREAARPDAFCEGVSCQDCPFCKDPVQGGCRIDDFVKSIPAADVVERPCWISVKERLPGSGVHVLAACRVKYVGGGGRSYVCVAFYSERFKEQRSIEYDDIELDYDEETDEYYLPEGWWEVIRNWDEYGFVGIADFVTHWMPLPALS